MAHVEAAIASSAEGRSLVICPVLSRQPIGREALPPNHFRRSSTLCKDRSPHREDRARPVCQPRELAERLEQGPSEADRPYCTKEQKRAEWVGSFGHGRSAHAKMATDKSHQGSSYDRKTDRLIPDLPSR